MTEQVAERFPPGEFIKEEMEARGWSVETLVALSGVRREIVEELIAGHRNITPVYALCLSNAFGTGQQLWLNLQTSYDELAHQERRATQMPSEKDKPLCQQLVQVETPYWREAPECGKPARFTWISDLRGKLRLCRRHAKAVGIEKCEPIED